MGPSCLQDRRTDSSTSAHLGLLEAACERLLSACAGRVYQPLQLPAPKSIGERLGPAAQISQRRHLPDISPSPSFCGGGLLSPVTGSMSGPARTAALARQTSLSGVYANSSGLSSKSFGLVWTKWKGMQKGRKRTKCIQLIRPLFGNRRHRTADCFNDLWSCGPSRRRNKALDFAGLHKNPNFQVTRRGRRFSIEVDIQGDWVSKNLKGSIGGRLSFRMKGHEDEIRRSIAQEGDGRFPLYCRRLALIRRSC
ncbi:unnamed protein product [Protopolystoma xenopodis]|uniref:Uncharacterized protein n=1 Tax=Protopolystoma xenopodis TaxID=117903 RepID=A0A448X0N6_9PLAT|nr:unnamed protein product [Protopolystoma xenopodis]